MSPTEIREVVEERLSMHDMTPEGGCSEDFRKKLKQFLENIATTLDFTMKAIMPRGQLNDDESLVFENVAQSVSGITPQQLQVFLNIYLLISLTRKEKTKIHFYFLYRCSWKLASHVIILKKLMLGQISVQLVLKVLENQGHK